MNPERGEPDIAIWLVEVEGKPGYHCAINQLDMHTLTRAIGGAFGQHYATHVRGAQQQGGMVAPFDAIWFLTETLFAAESAYANTMTALADESAAETQT